MMKALLISLFFIPILGLSQAPSLFKYQSIARDVSGAALTNSGIGIRISIHDTSPAGTTVFSETHNATTNDFGLFTIAIGGGTAVIGTLGSIAWSTGAKYMEIEADLTGGTSYSPFGTTQLLSVPYALYAGSSGVPILPNGTAAGNTSYWDGNSWVINSNNIYNNGGNVGVGTNNPQQKVDISGNVTITMDSAYMIDNRKMLWNKGFHNLFVGDSAGRINADGNHNSFFGFNAGPQNTIGSQNTFIGAETGVANLNGDMNSFLGRRAGFSNTNAYENTFIGAYAGQYTTEGAHNSFLGVTAGALNTLGAENTFLGAHAGYSNTEGGFNSFVGNFAGLNNDLGNYNTVIGFEADLSLGSLNNAAAYGAGAIVNSSNSVVIGNTSVTVIGGQVGWSTFSDRRLKSDIKENQLGLDFINQLETVTYEFMAEGQKNIRYTGLIAQDVESILNKMNYRFSGVVQPKNEMDYYSIRYAAFVTPLIKAVQEQSDQIKNLQDENKNLNERINKLEQALENL